MKKAIIIIVLIGLLASALHAYDLLATPRESAQIEVWDISYGISLGGYQQREYVQNHTSLKARKLGI
jgi:hypothetical protein